MLIGLFLKHIKAYKGINYIPIGHQYNFVSYIGENGIGKSSILEALDSYFNCKPYPLNKRALDDGIKPQAKNPFLLLVFLIKKSEVTQQKKEFEKISNIFWNIEKKDLTIGVQGSMKEFFEIREHLWDKQDDHFLIVSGETNLDAATKMSFASFQGDEAFITSFLNLSKDYFNNLEVLDKKSEVSNKKEEVIAELDKSDWRKFHSALKKLYSYIYLPVEIDIESFTKIETTEMQNIFDKKLKDEIQTVLKDVNFDNADGINRRLDNFVSEIEETLNKEYTYKTGQKRNNTVTKSDLVDKIIEVYFQKRTLYKTKPVLTKVTQLSAGEKRQALINLVYAFLKKEEQRERMVIIGIDEPESSLHTALCYEQFEKLKQISISNQVLITTHWYGFLPIVSKGYGHFLTTSNEKIYFNTYDLFHYRSQIKEEIANSKNKIPKDIILKSTYDLVQSIFYSLQKDIPYNWIICEGISEKIYFEYFFQEELQNKNLKILPMGGKPQVIRLYKYLETPMQEEKCSLSGKVYCLIDTDADRSAEINNGTPTLTIRRFSNQNNTDQTKLITLSDKNTHAADLEQALNPILFQETIAKLTDEEKYQIKTIVNESGNTSFHNNFKNCDLEDYFKENKGENKVSFAREYISLMNNKEDPNKYIPQWVNDIKVFFNQ